MKESLQWFRERQAKLGNVDEDTVMTRSSGSSPDRSPDGGRGRHSRNNSLPSVVAASRNNTPPPLSESSLGGDRSVTGSVVGSQWGRDAGRSHVHPFGLGSPNDVIATLNSPFIGGPQPPSPSCWTTVSKTVKRWSTTCVNAWLCMRRCYFMEDVPANKRRVASLTELINQVRTSKCFDCVYALPPAGAGYSPSAVTCLLS